MSFLTMLRHPNIIHLYDSFEYGELYYFIMERARGSIQDLIRTRGPLSEREVVALGRQDGEPDRAILSGIARTRARALGTPLGDRASIASETPSTPGSSFEIAADAEL
ncbi:MAG: hypothetical protein ACI8S6_002281 [Myxococcota bacterium]